MVTADLTTAGPAALEPAVAGADAVLSGLGPRSRADAGVASRGTLAIVEAMRATGVRRVVARQRPPRSAPWPGPAGPTRPATTPATGSSPATCVMPLLRWPRSARSTPTSP